MRLKPIGEQVVVVMGASSGIGRDTALRFAARGARVVVSARRAGALGSLVSEIVAHGGRAIAVPADVTNVEHVRAVANRAVLEHGRLDTWVRLSGVGAYAMFDEMRPEEFRRVIEVNLIGQAYGAMTALPHLRREGRGALIHVSSLTAKRAYPLVSAYSASKHGIDGFLEALRVELRHEGLPIAVTQVMPASINTPFFDNALTRMGVKPMGTPPLYEPGTVADVILYAAEHPSRDLIAGGAARMQILMQKLSPKLVDAMALLVGFKMQKTDDPKPADAPNNLFAPVPGDERTEGDFTERSHPTSLYNWLETHPGVRRGAVAGGAVALGALLAARSGRRTA